LRKPSTIHADSPEESPPSYRIGAGSLTLGRGPRKNPVRRRGSVKRKRRLRLGDFTGLDAAGAHANTLRISVDQGLDGLQVHVPAPARHVVRVRNVVAELRAFAANITNLCHDFAPNPLGVQILGGWSGCSHHEKRLVTVRPTVPWLIPLRDRPAERGAQKHPARRLADSQYTRKRGHFQTRLPGPSGHIRTGWPVAGARCDKGRS